VSHLKERKEKICLNCKTELIGRYCHVCGQENLEPKETVWHLVLHFFNDITHFDGKFFSTVKYLLRKPGFLSLEYMNGRRASYLNPIRMYVFTSAIFFILVFSLKRGDQVVGVNEGSPSPSKASLQQLVKKQGTLQKKLNESKDEDDRQDYRESLSHLAMQVAYIKKEYGDSTTRQFGSGDLNTILVQAYMDSLKQGNLSPEGKARIGKAIADINDPTSGSNLFGMHQGRYKSVAEYDSIQRTLPANRRDGWFKQKFMASLIHAEEEYRQDKKRYKERFAENMIHSFPKILFFSLPFFALILNMLYFRRKQYFYVDHGIFTVHVYCATFILMLFTVLISKLDDLLSWNWFHIVSIILITLVVIYMLIYLYMAMRGFYKQGRFKTFVKYFITCCLATVINLVLLLLFIIIAAISV
jgi:hypothetical protein